MRVHIARCNGLSLDNKNNSSNNDAKNSNNSIHNNIKNNSNSIHNNSSNTSNDTNSDKNREGWAPNLPVQLLTELTDH